MPQVPETVERIVTPAEEIDPDEDREDDERPHGEEDVKPTENSLHREAFGVL